jgi:hypothetical protein
MMEVSDLFQVHQMIIAGGIFRIVYGLALAVSGAALFLYLTLTAWDRFLFTPSLYSGDLRSILGWGKILLLFSGSVVFGMIASRTGASGKIQIIICCIAVSYWLFPYGFLEGTFLPIIPLMGVLIVSGGGYLGHKMNSGLKHDLHSSN